MPNMKHLGFGIGVIIGTCMGSTAMIATIATVLLIGNIEPWLAATFVFPFAGAAGGGFFGHILDRL